MRILGIETSCDDSAAAVVEYSGPSKKAAAKEAGRKASAPRPVNTGRFKVLASLISSQVAIHNKYGGVVPEVAARNHLVNLPLVVEHIFSQLNLKPQTRDQDKPDLIAVTSGPGLVPSLAVGVWTAQALSLAWQKPLVGINHMEGHILANWLDLPEDREIKLPALCLVVSGGHTELVWMPRFGKYQVIGRTRDDASGEAYDKVAKLVGLGYPGGPIIDELAKKGDATKYDLPRPMINSKDFDFSFSGLKTAVLYLTQQKNIRSKKQIADLAASFQTAVVDVLIEKTLQAAQKYDPKTILLAGGVAANSALRERLTNEAAQFGFGFYPVPRKFTTDNAAMIAIAGWVNRAKAKVAPILDADPNWELPE